jgi:hypothetical protein
MAHLAPFRKGLPENGSQNEYAFNNSSSFQNITYSTRTAVFDKKRSLSFGETIATLVIMFT